MNGGHKKPLGNVIEIPRISHCRSLGTPAVVFCECGKVLVIQFTFSSIQTCIIGRSSIKVAGIDISSLRGQEVTCNVNESGHWVSAPKRQVNWRTMTILVVIVLVLVVIADFGLKVDETADGRPSVALLSHNKHRSK